MDYDGWSKTFLEGFAETIVLYLSKLYFSLQLRPIKLGWAAGQNNPQARRTEFS